jgi:hypothetical protein
MSPYLEVVLEQAYSAVYFPVIDLTHALPSCWQGTIDVPQPSELAENLGWGNIHLDLKYNSLQKLPETSAVPA